MTKCDRCGNETLATTGSYFNTEIICMNCSNIEREHPKFDEARRVETKAVQDGNFKFPGIGLPRDINPKITRRSR